MRGIKQRLGRLDLRIEVRAEHHVGIGEGLDHVDDDQRRPIAEADLQAEAALLEEFRIVLFRWSAPSLFSLSAAFRIVMSRRPPRGWGLPERIGSGLG